MGTYLKLFETHSQYSTYINGAQAVLPNVSYCEDMDEVHYNPIETRLVAKFNVTSTSSATKITNKTSNFSEIEIDGVVQPSVVKNYTFTTTGEHVVKYTLTDPTTIGSDSFYNCSNLTNVTIPLSVTEIGSYAFQGTSISSVNIPSCVTEIGAHAFRNCVNITSVTIPSSVTYFGNSAFRECAGLTRVTIGTGVTEINAYSFYDCSNLTSVTIQATTPPTLGGSVFDNEASGRKIYVPATSVDTYKTAGAWPTYASDIEAIPT